MIIVSSREFRQNQRHYFEQVDDGKQVIVQRGKDKSYVLRPVSEDDLYFDKAMVAKLKRSLAEAESGETTSVHSPAELKALLGL